MLSQLFVLKPGKLAHERKGGINSIHLHIVWAKSHPEALPYVTDLSGRVLYVNPDSLRSAVTVALRSIPPVIDRIPRQRRAVRFPA